MVSAILNLNARMPEREFPVTNSAPASMSSGIEIVQAVLDSKFPLERGEAHVVEVVTGAAGAVMVVVKVDVEMMVCVIVVASSVGVVVTVVVTVVEIVLDSVLVVVAVVVSVTVWASGMEVEVVVIVCVMISQVKGPTVTVTGVQVLSALAVLDVP